MDNLIIYYIIRKYILLYCIYKCSVIINYFYIKEMC